MYIKELFINGFGIFFNKNFNFTNGINLIYGKNEAGKTTLMSFIRCMFFNSRRLTKYPPLEGGKCGGLLVLSDLYNNEVIVEKDFTNKKYTYRDSLSTNISEKIFVQNMGNITETLFTNVFCFGLTELENFKTLSGDEVQGRIYSAGLGSQKSLVSINQELEKLMDGIYLKGGRKESREVKKISNELKDLKSQINSLQENSEIYNEKTLQLKNIEEEILKDTSELKKIEEKLKLFKTLLSGWEYWLQYNDASIKLENLEKIESFPPNGNLQFENLKEEIREIEIQLQNKKDKYEEYLKMASLQESQIDFSKYAVTIRELEKNLPIYKENKIRLQDLERKVQITESKIADILKNLGDLWSLEKIEKAEITLEMKGKIASFQKKISENYWQNKNNKEKLTNLNKELKVLEEELEKVEEERALLDTNIKEENILERKYEIEKIENYLREKKILLQEKDTLKGILKFFEEKPEENISINLFSKIILIVLVSAFFSLFTYITLKNISTAIISGLVGALFGGGTFFIIERTLKNKTNKNSSSSKVKCLKYKEKLREISKKLTEIDTELEKYKNKYKVKEFTEDILLKIKKELEKNIDSQKKVSLLTENLRDLEKKATLKRAEIASLTENIASTNTELNNLNKKWHTYLEEKGLNKEIPLEEADAILEVLKTAKDLLEEKAELKEELKLVEESIEKYSEKIKLVIKEVPSDIEKTVFYLKEALEYYEEVQKDTLKLEKLTEELNKLFKSAGVEDEKTFLKNFEIFKKREELLEIKNSAYGKLKAVSQGIDFDFYMDTISKKNKVTIEEKLKELNEKYSEVSTKIAENRELKGSLETEINTMRNDEKLSEAIFKYNIFQEKLKKATKKWAVYCMTKEMLTLAKEKYEKERQPAVLKNAGTYLDLITEGAYKKVFAPYGENILRVENYKGNHLEIEQLSRGTAEQLYLSMRFALIQEFSKHAVPLPVIMDDTFVNFDETRLKNTVRALENLSETNQVLLFTCHKHYLDIFKNLLKEKVNIINL